MMLESIVRRQQELAEKLRLEREEAAAKSSKRKRGKAGMKTEKGQKAAEIGAIIDAGMAKADKPDRARKTGPEGDTKAVGVPVPLKQHLRMEALLEKLAESPTGPKSKKELMLRALDSYLNNFEKLEAIVVPPHMQAPPEQRLATRLDKAGYRDFFVSVGDGEIIVQHLPSVTIAPGALPKTYAGFLVRTEVSEFLPGTSAAVRRA